jgi:hypothetical protein
VFEALKRNQNISNTTWIIGSQKSLVMYVQNNSVIFNKSIKNKAENEFDIPHFEEHELYEYPRLFVECQLPLSTQINGLNWSESFCW